MIYVIKLYYSYYYFLLFDIPNLYVFGHISDKVLCRVLNVNFDVRCLSKWTAVIKSFTCTRREMELSLMDIAGKFPAQCV